MTSNIDREQASWTNLHRAGLLLPSCVAIVDGALQIEGIKTAEIARQIGTPVYLYSSREITASYRSMKSALGDGVSVCYAVKANGNLSVLSLLAQQGGGADVVSAGELERALAAGIPPQKVIFSGVGKSVAEIAQALAVGIHQFNVESESELELIAEIAAEKNVRAPVALRVNPDVDALTHDKISTGRKGDKFGIDIADVPGLYAKASRATSLDVVGLAVHIGSQILRLDPYRQAYQRISELTRQLRESGLAVRRLDLGGGLGISYGTEPAPSLIEYAAIVQETVGALDVELTVEPGRRLVGEAGILIAKVLHIKPGTPHDIVIVDAAMTELARPALYGAQHPILMTRPREGSCRPCRVVGPVCESADDFGLYANLPALIQGDYLAFLSAGAYGAAMASTYNARPLVPEVMIDGKRYAIIRRRQTVAQSMELESNPQWGYGPLSR